MAAIGGFSMRSPMPPEVASMKGSLRAALRRLANFGIDFAEHEAIRAAGKARARQAFVLKDVDAQRGPRAFAGLKRDGVSLVVRIGTRRHDQAFAALALGTERAMQIEIAIHGFVVIYGELRAVGRGGRPAAGRSRPVCPPRNPAAGGLPRPNAAP